MVELRLVVMAWPPPLELIVVLQIAKLMFGLPEAAG